MNVLKTLRRIRACESEVTAQLVFENAIEAAVNEALGEEYGGCLSVSPTEMKELQYRKNMEMSKLMERLRNPDTSIYELNKIHPKIDQLIYPKTTEEAIALSEVTPFSDIPGGDEKGLLAHLWLVTQ